MKTFQEFVQGLEEEACSTSSMAGASSDGTKKPKAKAVQKRKPTEDDVKESNSDE